MGHNREIEEGRLSTEQLEILKKLQGFGYVADGEVYNEKGGFMGTVDELALMPGQKQRVKNNVLDLGKITNDAAFSEPRRLLMDMADDLESGKLSYNKIAVLYLDDTNGNYNARFSQAGMSMSQMISLCEIIKMMCLKEMGFE